MKKFFGILIAVAALCFSCASTSINTGKAKSAEKEDLSFLLNPDSVKTGWRGTDGLQPESCDSIEGLYKSVESVRMEFNDLSEGVIKEFSSLNPILLKREKLKSVDRIKEKLRADQMANELNGSKEVVYEKKTDTYHCRTIRDCDGHTIYVRSLKDVQTLLKYFDRQPYVVRIKNNFANPTAVGYSDINMNIRLSNGVIVEMQLNTLANLVAKERYDHQLYEVVRAISINPKYKELTGILQNAQKAVFSLAKEYSLNGNFLDDIPNGNIFDANYKHEPYAKAIRPYVEQAKPLFDEAVADGVLTNDTIHHFNELIEYIK